MCNIKTVGRDSHLHWKVYFKMWAWAQRRDAVDSHGHRKERVWEIHPIVPVLLSLTALLLSLSHFWSSGKDQWKKEKRNKKVVCQQSSGYTVHPVLFPPNSKLPLWYADSRGGAEIHFTLQGKIHSAWIHKQVRMQIVHTSTIKMLFLGGKNSFTWQRMPDDFCHLTGEWVVSTAYL